MHETPLTGIKACVFDAYGTLFDVGAAAARCADALGDRAKPLADVWRRKQIEYTWLRSLMNRFEDFWQVTGQALDYAMESVGLEDPALRARLMQHYLRLDAYPEAHGVLAHLRRAGMKTALLSNGAMPMLVSASKSSGLEGVLDKILSVDGVRLYKPHAAVYQMAVDHFGVPASAIAFHSANAWDVAGAADYGFRVIWINRFGQPRERLPGRAEAELDDLNDVPALVGAG